MAKNISYMVPELLKLALVSSQAADAVHTASTPRSIKIASANKSVADTELVAYLRKLASAVLDSMASNRKEDELSEISSKKSNKSPKKHRDPEKVSELTPGKALALGSALALPSGLAGLALLNKAEDSVDKKMWAIPGVAAATVAAILAAREGSGSRDPSDTATSELKELADAVKVSFLIPELAKDPEFTKVSGDLTLANRHHIASLVNSLLFS